MKKSTMHSLIEMTANMQTQEEVFINIKDTITKFIDSDYDEDMHPNVFQCIAVGITKLRLLKEEKYPENNIDKLMAMLKDLDKLRKSVDSRDNHGDDVEDEILSIIKKLGKHPNVDVIMKRVDGDGNEGEWTDQDGNIVEGPNDDEVLDKLRKEGNHIEDEVIHDENGFCDNPDCTPCQAGKAMVKKMKEDNIDGPFLMGKGGEA